MLWFFIATLSSAFEPSPVGWERQHLGDYASNPRETLDGFLKRLGLVLDAHTRTTGHEACGVIGRQDSTSRYAVSLYTDGVQRGCSMSYSEVPAGFETTRETIHSHPRARFITLTAQDKAWNLAHNDVMHGNTVSIKPGFSQGDFDAGPGWLVFQGTLQYQRGWNRVRRFGKLPMTDEWPTRLDLETTLQDASSTPLSSHPVTVGSFGD
ncbi:MAG: hypothetical protein DI568_17450, partial [Sphingomonas sp.]